MASDLNTILKHLNGYFKRYKVVSEDEIAVAVSVEVVRLDAETKERLEEELHGDIEEALVRSIVDQPISEYSPNLTSKRTCMGETFYHYPSDEFSDDELDEAFKRLAKIRAMGALNTVENVVGAFLSKSGYDVVSQPSARDPFGCREMSARKSERTLIVYVIPSINSAADYAHGMDEKQEYVIVVPTDNTPAPFIQFCRDKAENFAGKSLQIWVVDSEKQTVNPFLGYTHDDDVYKNFENPKLASFACRMYGVVRKDMWVRSN